MMENYTVEEISTILKLHFQTVLKLLKSGDLVGFKTGRAWRVTKKDLEDFIERRKNGKK